MFRFWQNEKTGDHDSKREIQCDVICLIHQHIGMETKRDTATYCMERDMSICTTYNQVHLLDSVDISNGPSMVVL